MSYVNITKFLKLKKNGHLQIICSQKLIKSLTDIAVHISQIKRQSAGNFFLKRAKEYFFVSGPSKKMVDYMGIKIIRWYVMDM